MVMPLAEDAPATQPDRPASADEITLAEGNRRDISGLGGDQLKALQWEQEQAFARRILQAPKGSCRRAEAVRCAYETVHRVVGARLALAGRATPGGPLTLGLSRRDPPLVVELLTRWRGRGRRPRFFEIGYGSGWVLHEVRRHGFPVSGIEVSADMRQQALRLLGPGHADALLLGQFLDHDFNDARYSLIYWNDVFEHIPPDEIHDYLAKIHELLLSGGQLVTITPNWHIRPSDITGEVCGARAEAAGLHLREYTLRGVTRLLQQAGFRRVATPLLALPGRFLLAADGLADWKRRLEPCLEWLPFRLAERLCHGLALSCTIATKGRWPPAPGAGPRGQRPLAS